LDRHGRLRVLAMTSEITAPASSRSHVVAVAIQKYGHFLADLTFNRTQIYHMTNLESFDRVRTIIIKYVIAKPRSGCGDPKVNMKQPAVYIMASKINGTLYTGVTSNLVQRVFQHRNGLIPGFTNRYGCKILVYYELLDDMNAAISREKQI
jgi:putative endonuclease